MRTAIDTTIFKSYDVRGIVPAQLNDEVAYAIGRAFVETLGRKNICIGRDMRPSGQGFMDALSRGAADGGADVIVMDDGLQNSSLAKDLAIAVVDGRRGIGNGRVFPAGPLRAPLAAQLDHVDAVLLVGAASRGADRAILAAQERGLRVLHGELRPDPAAVAALAGKPVLAFAGTADPDKFFATLEACGIPAAARIRFPDHHRYTAAETASLVGRARQGGLTLVTTEKDMVRMSGDPAARALMGQTAVLPVSLVFQDEAAVRGMLRGVVPRSAP